MKKRIFIGSSTESISVAYALQQNLEREFECTVWSQGIFTLSSTTIDSLNKTLNNLDYAIFVFNADDLALIRGNTQPITRDNVIFELGLFIGKLGKENNFIIVPSGKEIHFPSDLLGITVAYYDPERSDGNLQASTGPACNQIRNALLPKQISSPGNEIIQKDQNVNTIEETSSTNKNNWMVMYFDKKYAESIEKIDNTIKTVKDKKEKQKLINWKYFVLFNLNRDEAIVYFEKEIKKSKDSDLFYKYILSLYFNHEYQKSLDVIKLAKDRKCFSSEISQLESDCIISMKSHEEICDHFNIKVKANPENEDVVLHYGKYLYDKQKYVEAKTVFINYLRNKRSEKVLFELARTSDELNENDISLYIYQDLIMIDDKNPTYYGYLGNVYLKLDLYNDSLKAYKKSKSLLENQAWIDGNIGNLFNNKGLYVLSQEYLDNAMKIEANNTYAQNRMATVLENIEKDSKKRLDLIEKGRLGFFNNLTGIKTENC